MALSYVEYTIRELRKKSGYKDDLTLMMMVKDQAGRFVLAVFSGLLKAYPCLRDEARRITVNIAKLQELLRKPS